MRVDHLARTPCRVTRGGQQGYVLVGFDHRDLRFFAGLDHAVGEVIMAHAIEHDHIQGADALDVFSAGLVGVRVEPGRNQRYHFSPVTHDVFYIAVVRVQGDADTQRFGQGRGRAVGADQGRQAKGEQAGQQQGAAAQYR